MKPQTLFAYKDYAIKNIIKKTKVLYKRKLIKNPLYKIGLVIWKNDKFPLEDELAEILLSHKVIERY